MDIHLIITNFRIIFEPDDGAKVDQIEGGIQKFIKFFEKQPSYVKNFFSLPLGEIMKISLDQNIMFIQTKDNRDFRISFKKA